jgi:hypothetical protein
VSNFQEFSNYIKVSTLNTIAPYSALTQKKKYFRTKSPIKSALNAMLKAGDNYMQTEVEMRKFH